MQVLKILEVRERVQPLSLEIYQILYKLKPKRYASTELFRGAVKKMTQSLKHNYFPPIFTEEIRSILPKFPSFEIWLIKNF